MTLPIMCSKKNDFCDDQWLRGNRNKICRAGPPPTKVNKFLARNSVRFVGEWWARRDAIRRPAGPGKGTLLPLRYKEFPGLSNQPALPTQTFTVSAERLSIPAHWAHMGTSHSGATSRGTDPARRALTGYPVPWWVEHGAAQ